MFESFVASVSVWLVPAGLLIGGLAALFLYRRYRRKYKNTIPRCLSLFDDLGEKVVLLDSDLKLIYTNGRTRDDAQSVDFPFYIVSNDTPYTLAAFLNKFVLPLKNTDQISLSIDLRSQNGDADLKKADLTLKKAVFPALGYSELFFVRIKEHDESSRKNQNDLHHPLSRLPSQYRLEKDLVRLFAGTHKREGKIAIMSLSLDNFSMLRSIIGREQGDSVIKSVAKSLEALKRDGLDISPYHTLENIFIVVVAGVKEEHDVVELAMKVQEELKRFYKIEEVQLYLTASIGIAVQDDYASYVSLMSRAYAALAKAQKKGYGHIEVSVKDEKKRYYDELLLYSQMHQALKKGEFEVYYQPIVRSNDKTIVAAEALVRWRHPKYGLIPPHVFVPIMEKTGFIIEVGRFMLEEVLAQMKRWEMFKFRPIEISINVALLELETGTFVENAAQMLARYRVRPELLKFELTETSAMVSESKTQKEIWDLKKLGVSISLDDFGAGFTSFAYLKKFPADTLKIDKSLIDYILTNKEDKRIVKAMVDLGHNLGMKIIVEGIENEKMYETMKYFGCDYMQGYYFGAPMPAFEFQKLLRDEER